MRLRRHAEQNTVWCLRELAEELAEQARTTEEVLEKP